MKYTIGYLTAVTVVVAVTCSVVRPLDVGGAMGFLFMGSFFLAPSLLALSLVPFQSLPTNTRQRLTLALLALLGLPVTIAVGIAVAPVMGFFLAPFALLIWAPQVVLLESLSA